jgi:phosphoglycolate phosphatase
MLDFDGVVVDSLEVFAAALIAACEEHGISAVRTVDDVVALFTRNVYESFRALGLDERHVARAMKAAGRLLERDLGGLKAFPGMPEVITRLGALSDVVIVTSNNEALVLRFLAENQVGGVATVAGVESGLSKTEKIRLVQQRYPRQAVYPFVADTAGDMREACAVGASPIAVAWGWHSPESLLEAGALQVVATPAELLTALTSALRGA